MIAVKILNRHKLQQNNGSGTLSILNSDVHPRNN